MAKVSQDRVYEFTLTGEIDCLMHRDDVVLADDLEEARNSMKSEERKRGDDRSPPWTWMTYVYHDGERVCCPNENVMASLRHGGAKIIIKGAKTFKEMTQAAIYPHSEYFDFRLHDGREVLWADIQALKDLSFKEQYDATRDRLGFWLFAKRAKVGASKHIRVRPRFKAGWTVSGKITVADDLLTDDALERIFEKAGNGGLFDWRPQGKTPGVWGRYRAKLKKSR